MSRLRLHGYKNLTALSDGALGISYSQLSKLLNGSAHMTLRHVATLEERLGPLLEVVISDRP